MNKFDFADFYGGIWYFPVGPFFGIWPWGSSDRAEWYFRLQPGSY